MDKTQLTLLEGTEILQQSSLDRYEWPQEISIHQVARAWNNNDDVAVTQAARRIPLGRDRFVRATAQMAMPERILWLLSHEQINFNGVTRVRNEPKWAGRLERIVRAGKPIPVAYPLFCAIANPAKQGTRPGPNAGELTTLHWFRYIDEIVREVYSPGLKFHILSDATLYNNALQNTLAFANAYIDSARAMIGKVDAEHCVEIHDYAMLLAPWARNFDQLYNRFYARLAHGDETLMSPEDRARLLRSVRANINSERLGLTFADQRALFGPDPDPNHPLAQEVERMAQQALLDQVAVKLACVELDLPETLWPDHIRASCHKGMKNGVGVVGLRVYPEYYRSSKLLPYHGKPLIRVDGRLVIQPEFMLRSRPDLTRIDNQFGEALLYRETEAARESPDAFRT